MYVRGFQLIRGIQHAILQICVCVRRGYANESVCEERVKLGECVRGVFVRIRYCTDVFFVVDVWSCVCYELFPRWTYIGINPYEWTRYSSFLKTHERKHVYIITMAPVTTQRIIRILANTACLHSWKSGKWAKLGMTQWDRGMRRPVPWRQETRFSNICSKVKGDQAVSAFFFPWESQEMSESLLTWFSGDCSHFIIGFKQLHSWTGYIFSDISAHKTQVSLWTRSLSILQSVILIQTMLLPATIHVQSVNLTGVCYLLSILNLKKLARIYKSAPLRHRLSHLWLKIVI